MKYMYSDLKKLPVSEFSELIRKYLRKVGSDKFENKCKITSHNGFWIIRMPRFEGKVYKLIKIFNNVPLRRYNLSAMFHRIKFPENYEDE